MAKRIKVVTLGRVAKDVLRWTERLAEGLERASPPKHAIEICIAPAPGLRVGDTCCFGLFAWPDREIPMLTIGVAGQMPADWARRTNSTRASGMTAYLETICHEYAHYEQYRAGRQPSERGVNVRARSLCAAALPSRRAA